MIVSKRKLPLSTIRTYLIIDPCVMELIMSDSKEEKRDEKKGLSVFPPFFLPREVMTPRLMVVIRHTGKEATSSNRLSNMLHQ